MTLVLLDSCDDFSSWVAGSGMTIVGGRNGNGWESPSSAQGCTHTLLPGYESDFMVIGFAVKFGALATNSVISFMSDAGATIHIVIRTSTTGAFSALRSATTLATSAAGLINVGQWYYLEAAVKLHDTTGTVVVRLNGVQVLTFTGDTKNAGTKTVFDTVRIENPNAAATSQYDDIYVKTGTGETFLGEIAVESLYPVGNGNANQWTPIGVAVGSNWQAIDEVPPSTADYVYSQTATQQELYAMSDLVGTGTIVGVCHTAYMLNIDTVTPRSIKVVNRRTTDTKSAAMVLTSAYRSYDYSLTVDPETGVAWTVANVNALQSGVELQ